MKKVYTALKILAVGLFVTAMTACSTTNHKSAEAWQGKVWRAVVVHQFVDTTTFRATDKDWIASAQYDEVRDRGIRMARTHLSSGWSSVIANVMVPDSVEFSQIPKGTLVDVMTETGPNMNYAKQRFTRIIRVICAKDDDKCIETENAAKRIRTVVDENPGDINAQYVLTFNRRITKEELEKYN